ncbi:bifunctional glycosyltransferase/CDP-glycerol:glycerophosphate glycerophosphotransferase [Demequina flava]|uniref:bifunctional glycosyltransferase/CDP-glycerol:glycerophosphate glycerophosphotransferase n=1 Tax=Demequina flava TaxID=1095025 RepID=UPI000AB22FF3|nr:CDP-glycerol glycerophosphotransferase family protein [Demequina flava]
MTVGLTNVRDLVEFTIVVPAYNVQGYLRQAVASVAGDPRAEVIVVDDCSTDATSVLADELAQCYAAVTVLRPDENSGLGMARNLGLKHATGEYVLFLDGDDYFMDGALDAIHGAVADHHPDVVLFGYNRLYPNGDAVEGVIRAPLQAQGPYTARQVPDVFSVLNVAWNKAYRRGFLESLDINFPVGYYEDIPWTYPILAAASSIVGIDRPLYAYRQRWSGSILRSTDARHLEILDQFERLAGELERLDIADPERSSIYDCAFRNLVTLQTTQRQRIPQALRRPFYDRIRETSRRLAPEGWTPPTTGHQVNAMRTVWSHGYLRFTLEFRGRAAVRAALDSARSLSVRIRQIGRRLYHSRYTYGVLRRIARVDESIVVLENLWGLSPRLNCAAVSAELRRSHPHLRQVWLVLPTEVPKLPEGTEYAVRDTHKYYKVLAQASHLFVDANLPGWWRKRPGQTVTQLHHGTPVKLMGIEERGKTQAWRTSLLKRCAVWDFSVVSNSFSAEVWKHSYPVKCETLEYGYPRNDLLVNATAEDVAQARTSLGLATDQRAILYVPTFRDRGANVARSVDLLRIGEKLAENDVLLVRDHYLAGDAITSTLPENVRDVSAIADVERLYLAADVMITDYSSAMFDYALLDRPIVILAEDWDLYSRERGTYFDITADRPGQVVEDAEALLDSLMTGAFDELAHRDARAKFRRIFCEFDEGTAARDVVARVIDGKRRHERPRSATPSLSSWNLDRIG